MKSSLGNFIKLFFYLIGQWFPVSGIIVLCYHSIGDGASVIELSPKKFRKQMLWLCKKRIRFLSSKDFKGYLKSGTFPREPSVLLTFDDGFKDNRTHAFIVQKELNLPSIIFLTTDYIGRQALWINREVLANLPIDPEEDPRHLNEDRLSAIRRSRFVMRNMSYLNKMSDTQMVKFLTSMRQCALRPMLSWEDILFMKDQGVCFESHSGSHSFLPDLPEQEMVAEISRSRSLIQERTGNTVDLFCYPYSITSGRVARALADANYLAAFTDGQAPFKRIDNRFAIPRVLISRDMSFWEFKFYFCRGFNWYTSTRDFINKIFTRGC